MTQSSHQTNFSLDGVRMAGAGTDGCGVVSAETAFTFEQTANVVSARYRGGEVVDGYLIGHLSGERLHFRYVQADKNGALDAGVSDCDLERLADGRLRLVEHFQWITREGSGTNVFEQIATGECPTCT